MSLPETFEDRIKEIEKIEAQMDKNFKWFSRIIAFLAFLLVLDLIAAIVIAIKQVIVG